MNTERPVSLTTHSEVAVGPAVSDRARSFVSLADRFWFLPVLAVYVVFVGVGCWYHEPWYDEAQAWLLARDCSIWELLVEQLRYEGHPPLWYLLVKLGQACGLPYSAFGLMGGVFAIAGAALFLAKSPLPRPLTALIPFTYYFAFQYAVVTRSYVLMPLLLFSVAWLTNSKWERPFRWMVAMVLLASVSLHTFLMAGGMMLVHGVELVERWKTLSEVDRKWQRIVWGVFVGAAILIAAILCPLEANASAMGINGRLPLDFLASLTLAAVNGAYFGSWALNAVLLAASCYWFWRTKVLGLFLAVWLPVIAIFLTIRVSEHHYGLLFFSWLFVVWRSWDEFAQRRRAQTVDRSLGWASIVMTILLVALAGQQINWSRLALTHEIQTPYCGAKSLARFIQAHQLQQYRINAVKEWVAAVLPYFPENFIANFPNSKGKSYADYRASTYAGSLGFSNDGSFATSCDAIIWLHATHLEADPSAREIERFYEPILPPHWRFVGNFPGRVVFKEGFAFYHGFSLIVTETLANELGLLPGMLAPVAEEGQFPQLTLPFELVPPLDTYPILSDALTLADLLQNTNPGEARGQYQRVIEIAKKFREEFETVGWKSSLKSFESAARRRFGRFLVPTDAAEAKQQFLESIRLNRKNAAAHFELGRMLIREEQLQAAEASLKTALQIEPHNPEVRQVLEDLRRRLK